MVPPYFQGGVPEGRGGYFRMLEGAKGYITPK